MPSKCLTGDEPGVTVQGLRLRESSAAAFSALLLRAVVERLGLIDLPKSKLSSGWQIDLSTVGFNAACRQIEVRVRLARRHGVDARAAFVVDHNGIGTQAATLADWLYECDARIERELPYLSGGEDLEMIGLPDPEPSDDLARCFRRRLLRLIEIRVRLARLIAVDACPALAEDDNSIQDRASALAGWLHERGARVGPELPCPSGDEDLLEIIGLPDPEVADFGRWFRRRLLRHFRRMADYLALCLGDIGAKSKGKIVSNIALASRKHQLKLQQVYARTHQFVSLKADGSKVALPFGDLASSAHKRFAKTYVRMLGLQEYCLAQGLIGFFLTLTLPPRFHPNPSDGKKSWDGSTPSCGHAEMQFKWRTFQRRFGESGPKVLGLRVEEPHRDACIHWHCLLWVSADRQASLAEEVKKCFGDGKATKLVLIRTDDDDQEEDDHDDDDENNATSTTYLLKYVLPSMPLDNTNDGSRGSKKSNDMRARYDAFRSTWGARAITFFDLPGSATLWDECRRIKADSSQFALLGVDAEPLHEAAIGNKYCQFLTVLEGLQQEERISVAYGTRDSGTRYVKGITVDGRDIDTHPVQWTVEPVTDESDVNSGQLCIVIQGKAETPREMSGNSGRTARLTRKRGAGVEPFFKERASQETLAGRRTFQGRSNARDVGGDDLSRKRWTQVIRNR